MRRLRTLTVIKNIYILGFAEWRFIADLYSFCYVTLKKSNGTWSHYLPEFQLTELWDRWEQLVNQTSFRALHAIHDVVTKRVAILFKKSVDVIHYLNKKHTNYCTRNNLPSLMIAGQNPLVLTVYSAVQLSSSVQAEITVNTVTSERWIYPWQWHCSWKTMTYIIICEGAANVLYNCWLNTK